MTPISTEAQGLEHPILQEAVFLRAEEQEDVDRYLKTLRAQRPYTVDKLDGLSPQKQVLLQQFLEKHGIIQATYTGYCPQCGEDSFTPTLSEEERAFVQFGNNQTPSNENPRPVLPTDAFLRHAFPLMCFPCGFRVDGFDDFPAMDFDIHYEYVGEEE